MPDVLDRAIFCEDTDPSLSWKVSRPHWRNSLKHNLNLQPRCTVLLVSCIRHRVVHETGPSPNYNQMKEFCSVTRIRHKVGIIIIHPLHSEPLYKNLHHFIPLRNKQPIIKELPLSFHIPLHSHHFTLTHKQSLTHRQANGLLTLINYSSTGGEHETPTMHNHIMH